ncbi:MAG: hypothetical protein PHU62_08410 [Bacteroidales bacterium]|jgi:tetratricopeptide (TPR) repeat protein|nr:hypothetical protein [Bacteroidales bacterium]MDD2205158.1 hypothetical protein [Bacteroidales bacterium]MDD3914716.1 hypothetical protein [Bacteroidales bacterium]MDD4634576.1 hypothetical protein [Bacteroidales bacterium]
MKKIVILFSAFLFCAMFSFSQTINEAGEKYNAGNTNLKDKDYAAAVVNYQEALSICNALGEEGAELGSQIARYLPIAQVNYAKALIKTKDNDKAMEILQDVLVTANASGDEKSIKSAKSLISSIYLADASAAYNAKNYDEAVAKCDLALEYNNTLAKAYLFKALSYKELEKDDELILAANEAMRYSKSHNDDKTYTQAQQTGNTYFLNKAQKLIQSKKYEEAVTALDLALTFDAANESTYYYKTSCLNNLKNYKEAINTGLLGLQVESESSEMRAGISLELARAYEATNDTANACTYYSAAAASPNFKEEANYKMKDVLKCN